MQASSQEYLSDRILPITATFLVRVCARQGLCRKNREMARWVNEPFLELEVKQYPLLK